MRAGEVWWVDFGERRPVVLLSAEGESGFLAMQVVPPAGTAIDGVAAEVAIGTPEGLPFEGVLRVAFPRPGVVPCTWLLSMTREDLAERVSTLPPAKLAEIENLVRLGDPA
ncbi:MULTISPECIES: type II toxin-antitoxin system PemK/MazF family toxin [Frankia]|uniref:type II toxin-antitoxin system PemK/MazF family toxin n=1 Tax=Frankia TaxID=1854 RepID=UPI0021BFA513|nr:MULTISPECIES: type II toxin-antitoxin system PemK/MazF family toxin [Frankia]